jgi:glutaredoxin
MIRLFFKTVRAITGPIILFLDWATTPDGIEREEQIQRQLDKKTASLKLYQFKTCPFCIKVRREIKRLSLSIETRDAQFNMQHRDDLLQGGGQIKVPCLRITDEQGKESWLYESDDIISHLRREFAS